MNLKGWLAIILTLILFGVVTYLIVAGLFWIVCWCFSLPYWSWKTAFGAWILCIMFVGITFASDERK